MVHRIIPHLVAGVPITVVSSPPGAGKTSLVVRLSAYLSTHLGVYIAAPTRAACIDLATRLVAVTEPGSVTLAGTAFAHTRIPGHTPNLSGAPIQVGTVASARLKQPGVDVMIFDEAYQVPFADLLAAAENADQLVCVGDPGQIGPVNALDISPWDPQTGPHVPGPTGFIGRPDTVAVTLDATYRLGETSARIIAPLYPFTFTSRRPRTVISGCREVETLPLPPLSKVAHRRLVEAVLGKVRALAGRTLMVDGQERALLQSDVAVVVSRNEQRASVAAALAGDGLGRVQVGTANSLQGGQWAAVVAVDPFAGTQAGSEHAADIGRLCVMLSRHTAHLTWVHSTDWVEIATSGLHPSLKQHLAVRNLLEEVGA